LNIDLNYGNIVGIEPLIREITDLAGTSVPDIVISPCIFCKEKIVNIQPNVFKYVAAAF
jgi:hypothetical protein